MKDIKNELLSRYLEGQCSEQEIRQVEEWLKEDHENQRRFELFKSIGSAASKLSYDVDPETNEQFLEFKKQVGLNNDQNIIERNWRSYGFKYIAAAILIVIVGFLIIQNKYVNFTPEEDQWITFSTRPSEQKEVMLPDGTKVHLNVDSQLKYPKVFDEYNRTVQLIGEAFFDVSRDESKPFIISANNTQTKVLGTSFNVRAYPGTADVNVAVASGLVSLKHDDSSDSLLLNPGWLGRTDGKSLSIRKIDLDRIRSWRLRVLIFEDTPLTEVLNELQRWYAIRIHLESEKLADCTFTSTFDNLPVSEALDLISLTFDARYTFEDNLATISSGSCR